MSGGSARLDWLSVPRIPLVDVKAQYAPLIPSSKARFADVLESGAFILGPNVRAFEEEAAAYLGVPHAIGVANGTDAIVLVLDALGDRPRRRGDLPGVHVLRDRRGDRPHRRDARLRRHRPGDAQPRSRGRRRADHAADEGDHARAPLRPPRAARRARRARRADRRGRRAGVRRRRDRAAPASPRPSASSRPRTSSPRRRRARRRRPTTSSPSAIRLLRFHGSRDKQTFDYVGTNSRLDELQAAVLRLFLRAPRRVERARGARRPPATPSSGSASSCELPADDPGHVYHMFVVPLARARRASPRPSATRRSPRAAYYVTPLHLQPALRYLG